MNFSPNINLTHSASIALISSLWNQKTIITDIKNVLLSNQIRKTWTVIENNVLLCLKNIILPNELRINLEDLVLPMGMQIFKWISLTQSTFIAYSYIPEFFIFSWTKRGLLDYVKTTMYVIDHCSDKVLGFYLACIFCIEKVIFELWPEVSPTESIKVKQNICTSDAALILFWVYHLNGEGVILMNFAGYRAKNDYEFAFLFALDQKCTTTLEYFLEHIQPDRRRKMVLMAVDNILHVSRPRDGNVLCFLLDYLKESDIEKIIRENTYRVLASLLEWPCHEFFMFVASSSWYHLSPLDYLNLFQDIIECVSRYTSGNIYKTLAKYFWRSAPLSYKEYVIEKCIFGTFLSRLFLSENTIEIVELVFSDCTPNEKRQMIFYFEGMNICDLLVKRQNWNLLKLFVTSCISSHADLEEFIEKYQTDSKPYSRCKEADLRTKILIEKIREWY